MPVGHRGDFCQHIDDSPGPGEYDAQKFLYKNTPAYSFGMKNYKLSGNGRGLTPAPLDYQSSIVKKRKEKKGFKFGTETRPRPFRAANWNPGPGEAGFLGLLRNFGMGLAGFYGI